MIKRILSVFLTVLLVAGLVMVPGMSVSASEFETINIADYNPGDKPATLGVKATNKYGYLCGFTAVTSADKTYYSIVAPDAVNTEGDNATFIKSLGRPGAGLYLAYGTNIVADTTYAISFNVRNTNPNGSSKVVYGFYGETDHITPAADYLWSEEISGSDWQTITKTVTVPFDGVENAAGTRFYTGLFIGLGYGSTHNYYKNDPDLAFAADSAIDVEIGSVYISEEIAFDVVNTLSATSTIAGSTVAGNAKVVNQLGEKSALDQAMTYFVTDKSSVTAEGFTVTKGENGDYEIAVGSTVEAGDYVVTARSSAYNVGKTENFIQHPVTLTVGSKDKFTTEHEASAITDDIEHTEAASVPWAGIKVSGSGGLYTVTAPAERTTTDGAWNEFSRPISGWYGKYRRDSLAEGDKLVPGNYVLSFQIRNNNTDINTKAVYGFVDAGAAWKGPYVWGEEIASTTEWQTISKSFTLEHTGTNNTWFAVGLGLGNTNSCYSGKENLEFIPNASVTVTPSSIYFAKEIAHDITVTADSNAVRAGNSVNMEASVVNQIDDEGALEQNFSWAAFNSDKSALAEGISIVPGADSSVVTVSVDSDVAEGTYVIVAYSEDYAMARSYEIEVSNINKFTADYVAPELTGDIGHTGASSVAICGATMSSSGGLYTVTTPAARVDDAFLKEFSRPITGWYGNYKKASLADPDKLVPGNYVLYFQVRNNNTNVDTKVAYGFVDGSAAWKGPYVWGEEISATEEWQTITKTFTFEHTGTDATLFAMGLGIGNTASCYSGKENLEFIPNASVTVNPASIYFAKEIAHDITVEVDSTVVAAGGTLNAEASVVNQIDDEGALEQNFSWIALNSSKTAEAEGITVTTGADTSVATISVDEDVAEGTYVIAAYSEDYAMAKSMVITVSNKVSVENIALDSASKKVTFDALNVPEGGLTAKVYIAEYTSNALKLEQAEVVDVPLTEGNNIGAYANYTKTFNEDNLIKIFVWKSDLTPLAEEVEVKKN